MRAAAALLLSLPAISLAQQIAIGAYTIPAAASEPLAITAGPDGAVWFTEGASKIGRITSAGAIIEYPLPTAGTYGYGITVGPDGALWFTEFNGYIGRITTAGVITEYPVPTPNAGPFGIAAGPDGALWFTEYNADQIGRITTAGAITEYPVAPGGPPTGITAGPDGALWFTDYLTSTIGRISTAGQLTEYPVPNNVGPYGITVGPDGALWFTGLSGWVGRITTAGVLTEYAVPASGLTIGITVGPDHALWFTGQQGEIGRITTAGAITLYPQPAFTNAVGWITTGPDGELWFTAFTKFGANVAGEIGEAVFVTANLSVNPATADYKSNLTYTGSGFAPNENVSIYLSGVGSAVLANPTADALGSFTVEVRAPQSPYGPRLFLGVGQSSGELGAANFSMAPRLVLDPDSGTVGSTAAATGYGFGAFERVGIYWNNPRTILGIATADDHGTFNGTAALTFSVPAGAAAGKDLLLGRGEYTGAIGPGSFTVE